MRIYLDVSCLNRMTDDQARLRIRLEAEAVELILERIGQGGWTHVSSKMVLLEIDASPDSEKRRRAYALLADVSSLAPLTATIRARAAQCQSFGFKAADAVHLAAAEALEADVLLTCDDRMLRTSIRNAIRLRVRVDNPLSWIKEQSDETNL